MHETAYAISGIGGDAQLDAAQRDLSNGLVRRALARVNHLLRDDAGIVNAWRLKAQIYQQLGFHAAAARTLRHAATATGTPALLVAAGSSLQALKQHEDAAEVYRAFLATAPAGELAADTWCNLGNALSTLGRDAEAEDAFKHALELEPTCATDVINYYVQLRKLSRWKDAIDVLTHGLRNTTDTTTRMSLLQALSHTHAELGDGAAALKAAEAALALDERSIEARYALGRALGLLGHPELAIENMKQILAADPDHADARRAVAALEHLVGDAPRLQQSKDAAVAQTRRPWWQFWN